MSTETTLRAEPDSLERLLLRLTRTLGHEVGGLVYSILDLFLLLQLPEFGADGADDHVLVLRQVFQGLKPACSLRVVLEVEGVDIQVLEELAGDDIVRTFGEMSPADEVASAQMHTSVKVVGDIGQRVVVKSNVCVEQVVYRTDVVLVICPPVSELLRAEV